MRLKLIIPVLAVPVLGVLALFSGLLPVDGSELPFGGAIEGAAEALGVEIPAGEVDDTAGVPDAGVDDTASADQPGDAVSETGEGGLTGDAGSDPGASAAGGDPAIPPSEKGPAPVADGGAKTADLIIGSGYLQGVEYGVALAQTTRVESATHSGWVNITLDLVLTSFSADPSFKPKAHLTEKGAEICLPTASAPAGCIGVRWGTVEQFTAVLKPHQSNDTRWPRLEAWLYPVTFEVPANATRASLVFGEHQTQIDLAGIKAVDLTGFVPGAAPTPPPNASLPAWAQGYYLAAQHGLAIRAVTRTVHPSEDMWAPITLDISVMSYRDGGEHDLPLTFATDTAST